MKITKCTGEGQGSCKRCTEEGRWNQMWCCFLYKIEGYDGCYCANCVKKIVEEEKMKLLNQYKCEICGTVYADKAKCEECEAGHKKVKKITSKTYRSININKTGFPDKITVASEDGKEALYKFIGRKLS